MLVCEEIPDSPRSWTSSCGWCDRPIAVEAKRGRRRLFCNPKCQARAWKGIPKPGERRRACEHCELVFEPKRAGGRFCSDLCRHAANAKRKHPVAVDCEHCGRSLQRSSLSGGKRFCSQRCSRRSLAAIPSQSDRPCAHCGQTFTFDLIYPHKQFCSYRCREAKRSASRVMAPPPISCRKCGVAYQPANYKTKYCKECSVGILRKPKSTKVYFPICVVCGTQWTSRRANMRFCSKLCTYRGSTLPHVRLRWERIYLAGEYEHIDPMVVLDRDRWTCQLCGVKTPKKLRGTKEKRAPEVDHIVPIARGGQHNYRNVQCACRQCNKSKLAKVLGQLRLFG